MRFKDLGKPSVFLRERRVFLCVLKWIMSLSQFHWQLRPRPEFCHWSASFESRAHVISLKLIASHRQNSSHISTVDPYVTCHIINNLAFIHSFIHYHTIMKQKMTTNPFNKGTRLIRDWILLSEEARNSVDKPLTERKLLVEKAEKMRLQVTNLIVISQ